MNKIINLFDCSAPKIRYKIVISGDPKVGKTRFIKSLKDLNSEKGLDKNYSYEPSIGTHISIFNFKHKDKNVSFSIWDCPGELEYSGRKEGYYNGTDCFIVMINKNTTRKSYEEMIKEYHRKNLYIKSNNKILVFYVKSEGEIGISDDFSQIVNISINLNDEVSIRDAFDEIKRKNLK